MFTISKERKFLMMRGVGVSNGEQVSKINAIWSRRNWSRTARKSTLYGKPEVVNLIDCLHETELLADHNFYKDAESVKEDNQILEEGEITDTKNDKKADKPEDTKEDNQYSKHMQREQIQSKFRRKNMTSEFRGRGRGRGGRRPSRPFNQRGRGRGGHNWKPGFHDQDPHRDKYYQQQPLSNWNDNTYYTGNSHEEYEDNMHPDLRMFITPKKNKNCSSSFISKERNYNKRRSRSYSRSPPQHFSPSPPYTTRNNHQSPLHNSPRNWSSNASPNKRSYHDRNTQYKQHSRSPPHVRHSNSPYRRSSRSPQRFRSRSPPRKSSRNRFSRSPPRKRFSKFSPEIYRKGRSPLKRSPQRRYSSRSMSTERSGSISSVQSETSVSNDRSAKLSPTNKQSGKFGNKRDSIYTRSSETDYEERYSSDRYTKRDTKDLGSPVYHGVKHSSHAKHNVKKSNRLKTCNRSSGQRDKVESYNRPIDNSRKRPLDELSECENRSPSPCANNKHTRDTFTKCETDKYKQTVDSKKRKVDEQLAIEKKGNPYKWVNPELLENSKLEFKNENEFQLKSSANFSDSEKSFLKKKDNRLEDSAGVTFEKSTHEKQISPKQKKKNGKSFVETIKLSNSNIDDKKKHENKEMVVSEKKWEDGRKELENSKSCILIVDTDIVPLKKDQNENLKSKIVEDKILVSSGKMMISSMKEKTQDSTKPKLIDVISGKTNGDKHAGEKRDNNSDVCKEAGQLKKLILNDDEQTKLKITNSVAEKDTNERSNGDVKEMNKITKKNPQIDKNEKKIITINEIGSVFDTVKQVVSESGKGQQMQKTIAQFLQNKFEKKKEKDEGKDIVKNHVKEVDLSEKGFEKQIIESNVVIPQNATEVAKESNISNTYLINESVEPLPENINFIESSEQGLTRNLSEQTDKNINNSNVHNEKKCHNTSRLHQQQFGQFSSPIKSSYSHNQRNFWTNDTVYNHSNKQDSFVKKRQRRLSAPVCVNETNTLPFEDTGTCFDVVDINKGSRKTQQFEFNKLMRKQSELITSNIRNVKSKTETDISSESRDNSCAMKTEVKDSKSAANMLFENDSIQNRNAQSDAIDKAKKVAKISNRRHSSDVASGNQNRDNITNLLQFSENLTVQSDESEPKLQQVSDRLLTNVNEITCDQNEKQNNKMKKNSVDMFIPLGRKHIPPKEIKRKSVPGTLVENKIFDQKSEKRKSVGEMTKLIEQKIATENQMTIDKETSDQSNGKKKKKKKTSNVVAKICQDAEIKPSLFKVKNARRISHFEEKSPVRNISKLATKNTVSPSIRLSDKMVNESQKNKKKITSSKIHSNGKHTRSPFPNKNSPVNTLKLMQSPKKTVKKIPNSLETKTKFSGKQMNSNESNSVSSTSFHEVKMKSKDTDSGNNHDGKSKNIAQLSGDDSVKSGCLEKEHLDKRKKLKPDTIKDVTTKAENKNEASYSKKKNKLSRKSIEGKIKQFEKKIVTEKSSMKSLGMVKEKELGKVHKLKSLKDKVVEKTENGNVEETKINSSYSDSKKTDKTLSTPSKTSGKKSSESKRESKKSSSDSNNSLKGDSVQLMSTDKSKLNPESSRTSLDRHLKNTRPSENVFEKFILSSSIVSSGEAKIIKEKIEKEKVNLLEIHESSSSSIIEVASSTSSKNKSDKVKNSINNCNTSKCSIVMQQSSSEPSKAKGKEANSEKDSVKKIVSPEKQEMFKSSDCNAVDVPIKKALHTNLPAVPSYKPLFRSGRDRSLSGTTVPVPEVNDILLQTLNSETFSQLNERIGIKVPAKTNTEENNVAKNGKSEEQLDHLKDKSKAISPCEKLNEGFEICQAGENEMYVSDKVDSQTPVNVFEKTQDTKENEKTNSVEKINPQSIPCQNLFDKYEEGTVDSLADMPNDEVEHETAPNKLDGEDQDDEEDDDDDIMPIELNLDIPTPMPSLFSMESSENDENKEDMEEEVKDDIMNKDDIVTRQSMKVNHELKNHVNCFRQKSVSLDTNLTDANEAKGSINFPEECDEYCDDHIIYKIPKPVTSSKEKSETSFVSTDESLSHSKKIYSNNVPAKEKKLRTPHKFGNRLKHVGKPLFDDDLEGVVKRQNNDGIEKSIDICNKKVKESKISKDFKLSDVKLSPKISDLPIESDSDGDLLTQVDITPKKKDHFRSSDSVPLNISCTEKNNITEKYPDLELKGSETPPYTDGPIAISLESISNVTPCPDDSKVYETSKKTYAAESIDSSHSTAGISPEAWLKAAKKVEIKIPLKCSPKGNKNEKTELNVNEDLESCETVNAKPLTSDTNVTSVIDNAIVSDETDVNIEQSHTNSACISNSPPHCPENISDLIYGVYKSGFKVCHKKILTNGDVMDTFAHLYPDRLFKEGSTRKCLLCLSCSIYFTPLAFTVHHDAAKVVDIIDHAKSMQTNYEVKKENWNANAQLLFEEFQKYFDAERSKKNDGTPMRWSSAIELIINQAYKKHKKTDTAQKSHKQNFSEAETVAEKEYSKTDRIQHQSQENQFEFSANEKSHEFLPTSQKPVEQQLFPDVLRRPEQSLVLEQPNQTLQQQQQDLKQQQQLEKQSSELHQQQQLEKQQLELQQQQSEMQTQSQLQKQQPAFQQQLQAQNETFEGKLLQQILLTHQKPVQQQQQELEKQRKLSQQEQILQQHLVHQQQQQQQQQQHQVKILQENQQQRQSLQELPQQELLKHQQKIQQEKWQQDHQHLVHQEHQHKMQQQQQHYQQPLPQHPTNQGYKIGNQPMFSSLTVPLMPQKPRSAVFSGYPNIAAEMSELPSCRFQKLPNPLQESADIFPPMLPSTSSVVLETSPCIGQTCGSSAPVGQPIEPANVARNDGLHSVQTIRHSQSQYDPRASNVPATALQSSRHHIPTFLQGIPASQAPRQHIPTSLQGITASQTPIQHIPTSPQGITASQAPRQHIPTSLHGITASQAPRLHIPTSPEAITASQAPRQHIPTSPQGITASQVPRQHIPTSPQRITASQTPRQHIPTSPQGITASQAPRQQIPTSPQGIRVTSTHIDRTLGDQAKQIEEGNLTLPYEIQQSVTSLALLNAELPGVYEPVKQGTSYAGIRVTLPETPGTSHINTGLPAVNDSGHLRRQTDTSAVGELSPGSRGRAVTVETKEQHLNKICAMFGINSRHDGVNYILMAEKLRLMGLQKLNGAVARQLVSQQQLQIESLQAHVKRLEQEVREKNNTEGGKK